MVGWAACVKVEISVVGLAAGEHGDLCCTKILVYFNLIVM